MAHIYITRDGCTYRYKATDDEGIYDTLRYMKYSHEEAEDIASWAELATVEETYETGNPRDEIHIGR